MNVPEHLPPRFTRPVLDPSLTNYMELAGRQDFFDQVASQLDPAELHDMARTSKEIQGFASDFARREFLQLLLDLGLSGITFLRLMRRLGVILSGQAVVRFLLREDVGGSPLDVYIHNKSPTLAEMLSFLQDRSYIKTGAPDLVPPNELASLSGVERVVFFERVAAPSHPTARSIRLVVVKPSFFITRPLAFHATTAGMTYISFRSIHCLFPDPTFRKTAIVLPRPYIPSATNPFDEAVELLDLENLEFTVRTHLDCFDLLQSSFSCPETRINSRKGTFLLPFYAPNATDTRLALLDATMANHVLLLLTGICPL